MKYNRRFVALGPRYSWSHIAAMGYLGREGLDGSIQLYAPKDGVEGIIRICDARPLREPSSAAIVPVFNSITGRIQETLSPERGVLRYKRLKIVGEYSQPIEQVLASNGDDIRRITEIYSHPQGLQQSGPWLEAHVPDAKHIQTSSTSGAAKIARDDRTGTVAAICSTQAANFLGLKTLAEDITGEASNVTRFWVLSYDEGLARRFPDEFVTTILTMKIKGEDEERRFYQMLGELDRMDIKVTCLEDIGDRIKWLELRKRLYPESEEFKELSRISEWVNVHGTYRNRSL